MNTAEHDLAAQAHEVSLAILNGKRDDAVAAADIATKRAAANKARDAMVDQWLRSGHYSRKGF